MWRECTDRLQRTRRGKSMLLRAISFAAAAAFSTATVGNSHRAALSMPCIVAEDKFLKIPPDRFLGDVSAVSVDTKGMIWVLHRPRTLLAEQREQALPPVVKFGPDGALNGGFGGPDSSYEWPTVEHSLAVASNGHVWISGSFRNDAAQADDMILEFTNEGKFVRQIGRRGASQGNRDKANVHAPGDLAIDSRRGEIYVADGYGNRRVVVFDAASGAHLRSWGAFGSPPTTDAAPPPRTAGKPFSKEVGDGPPDFNGVHGVALSHDGTVYVSDRNNQRIQAFTRSGKFLSQIFIDRNLRSATTASGIAFSDDAEQRYMFVADFGNEVIVVVDRRGMSVIGRIGTGAGNGPALTTPHLIASDGGGHLFVSEVAARRVRRLTIKHQCADD